MYSYTNHFVVHLKLTQCKSTMKSESEVAQSRLTLGDPMDCSLPGFSVHGIFQARVLEWVAISFSKGSSWPRDRTQVSCIAGRCFTLQFKKRKEKELTFSSVQFSSVQFSCSVVSDSLPPHESQHARPHCPSPTPRVHSDSRPSSQWCYPAISSSVISFSSCPQSLPALESFPMSQLFTWGGQSTGVSDLASFLPKKSQGWFLGNGNTVKTQLLEKWKCKLLSCVRLFVTRWTIQSLEFSRPEYWSG